MATQVKNCRGCIYLNKEVKQDSTNGISYRYGCDAKPQGYMFGWIERDAQLSTMGCSDCNKIKVGTSFLLNNIKCFYCGSIKTKEKRMYLIYNASTYVSNGYYVDMVEQEWFSEHIKDIVIERQTKELQEALKRTAKFYKKRIEECERRNK